jgi:hypothetical protein
LSWQTSCNFAGHEQPGSRDHSYPGASAILVAGLILMMDAPSDALLTAVRMIAGVVVLPVAMVLAAAIAQSWWRRRQGVETGESEIAPFKALVD